MHIHIVDDEPELLASLSLILRREGHDVQTFPTGEAFLAVASELPPGCVLLDLRLPDLDGLEVQHRLGELDTDHAVVLLTGFGEVPDAVSAMRAGAVDFLRKPYRRENLLDALSRAGEQIEDNLRQRAERAKLGAVNTLSERELEVLRALATGKQSKVVAYELGLSIRTIDMHRARIIKRLNVSNIGAALVMAKDARLI
ncbi:response regulator [Novosphingobium sp. G106]|uniref:response regulator transcription factor n=1 Tax=Novosphingobium sp. G106 TaxID=2849500 RepID=UPI001C2D2748|nr:response regulator [Novosphingobium sp. G106]MBV1689658.1 response regulator [Novosphingobium sp. G106]